MAEGDGRCLPSCENCRSCRGVLLRKNLRSHDAIARWSAGPAAALAKPELLAHGSFGLDGNSRWRRVALYRNTFSDRPTDRPGRRSALARRILGPSPVFLTCDSNWQY